ncbi:MAG: phosphatase PAP2 family protein [Fimbriimonadaceae bacterium]|nr:phosphatase PAP2 family protein [Fimbriimonadaceae bacterium]
MRGLDITIFRWINGWPDSFNPFFHFLSEGNKMLGVRIFLLAVIITMLIVNKTTRKAALLALLGVLLANALTEGLKYGFQALRPCVELADVNIRVNKLTSFGTASSHAGNMMAVGFVFTYLLGWRWSPWILLAILTGLSRIYIGVHYPSQVLLGWVCGAFCGLMLVKMSEAYGRLRRKSVTEDNADAPEQSPESPPDREPA